MTAKVTKTRIQLKNDTEAHWNLATNFIPLMGEVIIYTADDTHPFSRLKVGDGNTNVINLPFLWPENAGDQTVENETLIFS